MYLYVIYFDEYIYKKNDLMNKKVTKRIKIIIWNILKFKNKYYDSLYKK